MFVITIEADGTFDYEGLEKVIYAAVSSYGIDITSQLGSLSEFKIPEKEFLVALVQYLILKLLISENMIVRMSKNHQIVKL